MATRICRAMSVLYLADKQRAQQWFTSPGLPLYKHVVCASSSQHQRDVFLHVGACMLCVMASAEAVPKKILELMMVEGLTRENVASHLQKYRLYLKRVQTVEGVTNHHTHHAASNPKASSKPNNPQGVMQAVQQQQHLDPQQMQQQPSIDMQQQQQGGVAPQPQPQQQPQQQQPQQQLPGVMPGMGANGSLGMMSPFGPQSMQGMGMTPMNGMNAMNPMAQMMAGLSQMGMPGMPGVHLAGVVAGMCAASCMLYLVLNSSRTAGAVAGQNTSAWLYCVANSGIRLCFCIKPN